MSQKNTAKKNSATDEQLEEVSGGERFQDEYENGKWRVIEPNGYIHHKLFDTEEEAIKYQKNNDIGGGVISHEEAWARNADWMDTIPDD